MSESEAESVPSFSAQKPGFNQVNDAKSDKGKQKQKLSLSIIRYGDSRKKKPLIRFSVQYIFWGLPSDEKMAAAKWHLAYKFVKTESKIVRNILHQHCFQEVHPNSSDFNLMWTGSHLKPHSLRGLHEFQKINHFPRSYELTRKDRLYQNIQKMQHSKGFKNFDFIPEAYVLPAEYNQFCASYAKQRGLWIVKPVASSRGRGIFLINHPSQVLLDDTLLISKYIANPLLVDGFKFDLRLYIGVTSFDPLRIYLYEEGLTRFATVKYDQSNRNMKNSCMHLTNYSVNKKSDDYVSCNDPEVEDYGNKWSFGALLRFLKGKGVDTTDLVTKIEDLVIKTIIAGELPIATACKMFVPFPGNCFEIYGFDVLIDENLKPWLLEVNLSPSMACDSPMDLKIKSNLLTDMFNLTGFVAQDPLLRKVPNRQNAAPHVRNQCQRQRCQSAGLVSSRALSVSSSNLSSKNKQAFQDSERGLTAEELRALRETRDEYTRRGGFVRIFPSPNSRELYSSFLEYRTTNNRMLSARLFLDKTSRNISRLESDRSSLYDKTALIPVYQYGQILDERMACYERQLPSLGTEQHRKNPDTRQNPYKPYTKHSGDKTLAQGQLEVRSSELVSGDRPSFSSNIQRKTLSASDQVLQREEFISKAGSLSKFQARKAFGTYLQRVRRRLVKEVSCDYDDSGDEDEKAKQDEQMNLVIRFLKRAAKNLRQEFKVLIPSHKLPMQDRRRMLAQQLGDFVHIYDKETNQMKETDEVDAGDMNDEVSKQDFKMFLGIASETELEELLTNYTRVNNNASIFLGSVSDKVPSSSISWKHDKPPLQRQTESRKHLRSHSAHAFTPPSTRDNDMKQKSDPAIHRMSEQNRRLASAVSAYSKSLAVNATKKRPSSANALAERKKSSTASACTRPISAKILGDKPFTMGYDRSQVMANEKSVSEALKTLAKRQAVRQYAARPSLKIETNKWAQPGKNVEETVENRDNTWTGEVKPKSTFAGPSLLKAKTNNWVMSDESIMNKDNCSTERAKSGSHYEPRHNGANETFSKFVHRELQVTSKPSHPRNYAGDKNSDIVSLSNDRQYDISRTSNGREKAAEELTSSIIRIPYGDRSEVDTAADTVDKLGSTKDKQGLTKDKLGSAREDYNKHVQLLVERLAAHKFDKTSKDKVVPKPPARPRSAKRSVSAQRMSRITTSHGSVT